MRPTVSKKVVLGFAIVLAMGTIAVLMVYDGLARVGREMRYLAEIREPSYSSTLEIEINLNEIVLGCFAYLRNPEERYRTLVQSDEADVAGFLRRYAHLAATEAERKFAARLGVMFEEFHSLADSLMQRRDRQEAAYITVTEYLERADATIDRRLHLTPGDPRTAGKLAALSDLEADLAEVAFWLANYQRTQDPTVRSAIEANAEEFRATFARLNTLRLTPREATEVEAVGEMFDLTMVAAGEVLEIEDDLRRGSARFLELHTRLDSLLDEEIQPLGLQQLYQPRRAAGQAMASVLRRAQWLVPAVLMAAMLVAAVLIYSVVNPLRRLKAGTEALAAGDLSHRIVVPNRDEFGDLADEFNRMAERLQGTTVSKEALERSERRLRRMVKRLRREIGERIRAEAEGARLETSLRRAETMSVMGTLVAGVAHEVRNPLFGMLSVLDAMEARFADRADLQPYSTVLREEAGRLNRLMQELIEYGRPPHRELAPAALGEVLAEALRHNEPLAAEAGVRLVGHIPPELPPVALDRDRLLRVFQNLLENAIQHSRPEAEVVLESRALGGNGDRWIECVIADSGPGFRPEDLPHVFEPFFSRRRGGTGLGLSIVQRIAGEHGGEIVAANRPEGGAMMTVRLPVHREPAIPEAGNGAL